MYIFVPNVRHMPIWHILLMLVVVVAYTLVKHEHFWQLFPKTLFRKLFSKKKNFCTHTPVSQTYFSHPPNSNSTRICQKQASFLSKKKIQSAEWNTDKSICNGYTTQKSLISPKWLCLISSHKFYYFWNLNSLHVGNHHNHYTRVLFSI